MSWVSFCFLIIFASAQGSFGQSSVDKMRSDPKSQYYIVKGIMRDVIAERNARDNNYMFQPGAKKLNLLVCENIAGTQDINDHLLSRFAFLSSQILGWRGDVVAAGFPENVWRPPVIKFEDQSISRLLAGVDNEQATEKFKEELRTILNNHREQSHNSTLPIVVNEDECGGGPDNEPVLIKTYPPGARVALLSRFRRSVCEVNKIDPLDSDKCKGWVNLASDTRYAGLGSYTYCIQWKNEKKSCADVDFNTRVQYDYDGKPKAPLVLVKPL